MHLCIYAHPFSQTPLAPYVDTDRDRPRQPGQLLRAHPAGILPSSPTGIGTGAAPPSGIPPHGEPSSGIGTDGGAPAGIRHRGPTGIRTGGAAPSGIFYRGELPSGIQLRIAQTEEGRVD